MADGGPERPVRYHGIIRIRHRDDTGPDCDVIATKSAGISRTVIAFVMLQDHYRNGPRKIYFSKDVVPGSAMLANDLAFRIAEIAGLYQDFKGNIQLPEIMDPSRHFDANHISLGQIELLGNAP